MKVFSIVSRLYVLNTYLRKFPPGTEAHEITPFSTDEIMDIIYRTMHAA